MWEIERDRHGLMFSGPLEVGECLQVVPCDGAAVERAARALHKLQCSTPWEDRPSFHKAMHLDEARAVLRAAGETP